MSRRQPKPVSRDQSAALLGFAAGKAVVIGAAGGTSFGILRQGAQIIDDPSKEFSWDEVVSAAKSGAVIGPAMLIPGAPVAMAAMGVKGAIEQFGQGHIATGLLESASLAVPSAARIFRRAVLGSPIDAGELAGSKNVNRLIGTSRTVKAGEWESLHHGVRIRRVGSYWIKEVDPTASRQAQWYGRKSIEAQAEGLAKLGDKGTTFLYRNGRIVTRDAGEFTGGTIELLKTKAVGAWRLKTVFTDVQRRNIGEGGIIFDPARHPVAQDAMASGLAFFGGAAWWFGGKVAEGSSSERE